MDDVKFEDQMKINQFAQANSEYVVLRNDLTSKKKDLQSMDDAVEKLEELELVADDELGGGVGQGTGGLRVSIGVEAFFDVSNDDAKEYIEKRRVVLRADVEKIEKRIVELTKTMDGLRSALYARFGANNINLEYEKV